MALGETITRLRIQKGLRQQDLADQLGVLQSHIARWENNINRPRPAMVDKLAEALEVPLETLLASDHSALGGQLLKEKDPNLVELFNQAHLLSEEDRSVIRTLLESLLTRVRLQEILLSQGGGKDSDRARPRMARRLRQPAPDNKRPKSAANG